jgi:hypothetical protein
VVAAIREARARESYAFGVDKGLPIAYHVLEKGVPVYASGGEKVGRLDRVVAEPELDIFHGLVVRVGRGRRFVAAEQVASLHERGVDLSIDAREVAALPEPHGAALIGRNGEPRARRGALRELMDRLRGRGGGDRGWP